MFLVKKIFSAFKNTHFQSLLGNGVMAVFGMVTFAILYRVLSIKDVGIYGFFISVLGLIDTFRSGFLTNSFIKFYSGTTEGRAREVAGSAWALALSITGVSILINIPAYLLSSHIKNESVLIIFKYFSLISLSTLPSFMANLVVQGDKRFDRLLWLRLINQVLFMGMIIIAALLKKATLTSVVQIYISSNLITSITVTLFGWTRMGAFFKATKSCFGQLFHFGKYSVGTSISSTLFKVTDSFFINFYLGPAALAAFNLGGRLLQLVEIPLLSFAASGMPVLSGHHNNGRNQEMMFVMKKMTGMLSVMIMVMAVVAIIFAEPVIQLIGGEKYLHTAAPNLFRLFMCVAILYPSDRFLALTLDVIHKPQINLIKIVIMLMVNLVADYVGMALFKSVYSVVIADFFPILVAIIIAYYHLNKFQKFTYFNIYVIGYKEIILFIKQIYHTLFAKNQHQTPS